MKRIWKSLVMGMLVAVAGRSAQAQAQGSYSDRPLSPGSVPTGTLGTDLLLTENCTAPNTLPNGQAMPAGSWTTGLQMYVPNGSGGWNLDMTLPIVGPPPYPTSGIIWKGNGPTGLYAAGKAATATVTTHAYVAKYHSVPSGCQYQYIIHDISYNPTTGVSSSNDVLLGQRSCS